MSVVFLGTSEFAAAILERLAASDAHRPSLVLSRPDRPRGRGRRVASPPVAERARALALRVEQPASVNDASTRELIASTGARTVVVCAFGALIKEPLLSEYEMLNVHPSLLPRWRGAAPIERAIMAGDTQTGVSIMRLTAGLDSGPVFLAGREPIESDDTYGTLTERLERVGGELLLDVLDRQDAGAPLEPSAQDELAATYAEKIAPEDRLLDPSRTAVELERVVRALEPQVVARVALEDGALLGVHSARVTGASIGPAEGVAVRDGRLLLACREGALELTRVQPPGGRAMDAASYLRGHGV